MTDISVSFFVDGKTHNCIGFAEIANIVDNGKFF